MRRVVDRPWYAETRPDGGSDHVRGGLLDHLDQMGPPTPEMVPASGGGGGSVSPRGALATETQHELTQSPNWGGVGGGASPTTAMNATTTASPGGRLRPSTTYPYQLAAYHERRRAGTDAYKQEGRPRHEGSSLGEGGQGYHYSNRQGPTKIQCQRCKVTLHAAGHYHEVVAPSSPYLPILEQLGGGRGEGSHKDDAQQHPLYTLTQPSSSSSGVVSRSTPPAGDDAAVENWARIEARMVAAATGLSEEEVDSRSSVVRSSSGIVGRTTTILPPVVQQQLLLQVSGDQEQGGAPATITTLDTYVQHLRRHLLSSSSSNGAMGTNLVLENDGSLSFWAPSDGAAYRLIFCQSCAFSASNSRSSSHGPASSRDGCSRITVVGAEIVATGAQGSSNTASGAPPPPMGATAYFLQRTSLAFSDTLERHIQCATMPPSSAQTHPVVDLGVPMPPLSAKVPESLSPMATTVVQNQQQKQDEEDEVVWTRSQQPKGRSTTTTPTATTSHLDWSLAGGNFSSAAGERVVHPSQAGTTACPTTPSRRRGAGGSAGAMPTTPQHQVQRRAGVAGSAGPSAKVKPQTANCKTPAVRFPLPKGLAPSPSENQKPLGGAAHGCTPTATPICKAPTLLRQRGMVVEGDENGGMSMTQPSSKGKKKGQEARGGGSDETATTGFLSQRPAGPNHKPSHFSLY